jgi:hypothetical protein
VGLALAGQALARVPVTAAGLARCVGWASLSLVVTGQILALVAAMAPPTAKDTLLYHYALPKAWIAAGRAIEIPYNIAGYYPLGVRCMWSGRCSWARRSRLSRRRGRAGATLFSLRAAPRDDGLRMGARRGADRSGRPPLPVIAWILPRTT